MLDLAIIGGGPAGLSAGLYATRGGLKDVIMFEKAMLGGQITSSSEIENYPGATEVVSGLELMEKWPEQCMRFGLKHSSDDVLKVSKSGENFQIQTANGNSYEAKAVIFCTGSNPRRGGFNGEDEFFGRGVSTCATCDGFFYKNKEVAVLGGGDTAMEEALYLANICSKVYLVHRREGFRAAPITVEKVKKNEKIELVLNAKIDEAYGDKSGLLGIKVKFTDGSQRDIKVPGIFTFVGRNVNNESIKQDDGSFLCATNEQGEIIVDLKMKTNVAGFFAAGDIRIDSPKQVVSAAGDGAVAALSAMSYIESLHD